MRFKFSVLSYFLIPADKMKELPVNLKVDVSNIDFGLLIFFFSFAVTNNDSSQT